MRIIDQEVDINADYLSLSFFGEIEITELEKLYQLKKLTHLNLSSSDLLDQHLEIIGQLESIKLLDLDSTEITDDGLQNLKPLKQLSALRLKDNPQLTDKCIAFLSDLEQLELVHIENTSISLIGLKKLLKQKELNAVLLDLELDHEIHELLSVSQKYPTLEITVKGKGVILNGKLNQ